MSLEVIGHPSEVDAPWLTAALERAGVARGASVTDVELVGLIGTGQMGSSARFRLTWDDPDGRPTSLVGKFPTDDATVRTTAFAGAYLKEWLFYEKLQPTVGVRAPHAYVVAFDAEAERFAFLMEDLHGSEQGDQFRGLTVDEAALGVEQAVALHAPRWGDDRLQLLWGGLSRAEGAERLELIYQATLEGSLARIGPAQPPEAVGLARRLGPLVSRWLLAATSPSTLAHMDFRPDNFLFGVAPDAPPLAVVDWQTITYGPGVNDVAYMIGGSFEPDERAGVERNLVADYAARLRAAGIAYDDASCWDDYRLASLWGVVMSVIATMLAAQTERGDRMLATMLRRHAAHALDLDALALLV